MEINKSEMMKIKNAVYYFSKVTRERGDRDQLADEYYALAMSLPNSAAHLTTEADGLLTTQLKKTGCPEKDKSATV